MGWLSRSSTVVTRGRFRAAADDGDPFAKHYNGYVPAPWVSGLSHAGIRVTPELALTLSAVYCAVTTIADDIATMPCHLMRYTGDEGDKSRARNHPLAYVLRWQPNGWQTAREFWACMIGHLLLRNVSYARIVPGPRGNVDQLIPLHPDRVKQERIFLPEQVRVRYELVGQVDEDGRPARLTQDEVFCLRDLAFDGLAGLPRVTYGANAIGSGLAQEKFTGKFFQKGATAALVATRKGGGGGTDGEDNDDATLHASLTRYAAGAEHAGGILIIDDDIDIKSLGIDPDKAQLLGLKDYSVREVARLFKMPAHKLEASQQTQAYAAREQANLEYLMGCLRPIIVGIEQAVQRDLITAKDTYFAEFLMEALLRGDLKSRADYYSKAILNRWMWPSEVRRREGMNGDAELDRLSAEDHRAGAARTGSQNPGQLTDRRPARETVTALYDAVRCVKRERIEVGKLAKKHAADAEGWRDALRDFYAEHAGFVARTMQMPIERARAYAAQHGSQIETHTIGLMTDGWERAEAADLVELAFDEPLQRAA